MLTSIHRRRADEATSRAGFSGFSIVEVMIVAVLLPILAMAAFAMVDAGREAQEAGSSNMRLSASVRIALRRIHDELIRCGKVAEDSNGNGKLDTGEDSNSNGRLDADWSISSSKISFNRREVDGTWSLPVTYELVGTDLVRTGMRDASGLTQSTIIVRNVSSFTLTESNGEIVVNLAFEKVKRQRTFTGSGSIRVALRN